MLCLIQVDNQIMTSNCKNDDSQKKTQIKDTCLL